MTELVSLFTYHADHHSGDTRESREDELDRHGIQRASDKRLGGARLWIASAVKYSVAAEWAWCYTSRDTHGSVRTPSSIARFAPSYVRLAHG